MQHRFLHLVALAISLAGCGSSSSSSDAPPTVTLTGVLTSAGESLAFPTSSEATLNLPCDGALVVSLAYSSNWTPQAPGNCGSTGHCGHVEVDAQSPTASASASGVFTPVLVDLLAGGTLADWSGELTLKATLLKDDGSNYTSSGKAISNSASFVLIPSTTCSSGGANTGGAAGAGGEPTGGAPGTDAGASAGGAAGAN